MWWQRMEAKEPKEFRVDYWKARSALMLAEGQRGEAEEAFAKGNKMARELPAMGGDEFDRWSYDRLREALDAPVAVPPPLPVTVPPPLPVAEFAMALR